MIFLRDFCKEYAYLKRVIGIAAPLRLDLQRRYGLGGTMQAVLDLALFFVLRSAGVPVVASHISSFLAATVAADVVFLYGSESDRSNLPAHKGGHHAAGLSIIMALMVLFLRGGLLALMTQVWEWKVTAAMIPLAVLSAMLVLAGRHLLYSFGADGAAADRRRWHIFALVLVLYSLALRVVYIPVANLIPEEAYYWNYAQHLDWGYLDHPPMVAWIIKLGTIAFGNTEFGVRIGAAICWLVAAAFGYGLARELLGRRAAVGTVLLLSTLPFFFGTGCLLTPDAPLAACWAGALFFLHRALVRGRSSAWLGAGVCIGLGTLSKYTIGLLVPAVLLFVLIDPSSHRWLARPQPYIACLVAAVLFSPVVYWNATHGWASFVFQTARRVNEEWIFSLHVLLAEIMLLLTPIVLAGAVAVLLARGRLRTRLSETAFPQRSRLFLLCFTLTPLAVFTAFSITHEPKLNWTGPAWLAVLPFLAWVMAPAQTGRFGQCVSTIQRLWAPTIIAVTLFFGAAFHYLVLGFPGVPYPSHTSDIAGWRELQHKIAEVEITTRAQTGTQPLIVGMDRYNISSELAFYGAPEGPRKTAGRHLFGQNGLMYRYWFPESEQNGKQIILVARERVPLEGGQVASRFDSLSQIGEVPVSLNGRPIGEYYYRVGFGYQAAEPAQR